MDHFGVGNRAEDAALMSSVRLPAIAWGCLGIVIRQAARELGSRNYRAERNDFPLVNSPSTLDDTDRQERAACCCSTGAAEPPSSSTSLPFGGRVVTGSSVSTPARLAVRARNNVPISGGRG